MNDIEAYEAMNSEHVRKIDALEARKKQILNEINLEWDALMRQYEADHQRLSPAYYAARKLQRLADG